MKILKPGKVEQRKFTCPKCGCEFVVRRTEMMWTIYGLRICCPTCDENHNWENGEPYEEPVQLNEAVRKRLLALPHGWENNDLGSVYDVVELLLANDVTLREV